MLELGGGDPDELGGTPELELGGGYGDPEVVDTVEEDGTLELGGG